MTTSYRCKNIVRPKYDVERHILRNAHDLYGAKVQAMHYDGEWSPEFDRYLRILNECLIKYGSRKPYAKYSKDFKLQCYFEAVRCEPDFGPEYEIYLPTLNGCIGKWPHYVNCEVYDTECDFAKPYSLNDYMETVHSGKPTSLSVNLDDCVRKNNRVYDPIRNEWIDLTTGLVY